MKHELPPNPADIHGPNAGEPGYEEIKKGINESGDDLYIGTREEIDKARAKVEAEGRTPDLAGALRMHKEVPVMAEALEKLLVGSNEPYLKAFQSLPKGAAELIPLGSGVYRVYYKDAAGNLAKAEIDITKIDEFKDNSKSFQLALESLGFTVFVKLFEPLSAANIAGYYFQEEEKKQREQVKQDFSF